MAKKYCGIFGGDVLNLSTQFIKKMPKTDLHCHFDGSIRITTLIELAKKNKVNLFSYEPTTLMTHMKYGQVRHNLEDYLTGFEPLIAVLQDSDAIEQAFYEICEDAHLENVWHLELRYCPYLHTKKGLTSKEVIEACIRASNRAEQNFTMSVKHILCGLKNDSPADVFEMAKLASVYRDRGVVGFDLAGPEKGFPIKAHKDAIYLAKENHLFITMHAGESCGPESILEALHEGYADRIGHGTSLLRDPALLDYIVNHRIGVEACPLSNWHTGATNAVKNHPIKAFLEKDVRVSINTDNRIVSDTTITKELISVTEQLDLTLNQIKKLLLNGFKSAFLPYKNRSKMIENFNSVWDDLLREER